jgi:hypothetical protein
MPQPVIVTGARTPIGAGSATASAAVKDGRLGEEIVAVSKTGRDSGSLVEQDEGASIGHG